MSRVRSLGLPLIALMISLGGVAWATIPSSNGIIHACFNTQTGAVRVVDAAQGGSLCATGEQGLTWASSGPRGLRGDKGPRGSVGRIGRQGPPGPRGGRGPAGPSGALPHGPRIRLVTNTYYTRRSYRAYATCRPNEEPLSGGAALQADPYTHVITATASFSEGDSWVVDLNDQASLDPWTLVVYAECWRRTP